MRTSATRVPIVLMLVLLTGCSGAPDGQDAAAVAVSGSQTCRVTTLPGGTQEDGAEVHRERFDCTDTLSDPRVSGADVFEVETLEYEGHSAVWTVADATLSNDAGTWRGSGSGAIRFEAGVPYNYGEMVYTGAGAYDGLTYHYLVAGSNEELVIAGWIEPAAE